MHKCLYIQSILANRAFSWNIQLLLQALSRTGLFFFHVCRCQKSHVFIAPYTGLSCYSALSLQEPNVSLFTESSHSKRLICQSAVQMEAPTNMQTCHRGEQVRTDAQGEGVSFTQNRQANWGKNLNIVVSCRMKVNCHSVSSRSLMACVNSKTKQYALVYIGSSARRTHYPLFFFKHVLKVQRDSEWTNAHWRSRDLITSTIHSY